MDELQADDQLPPKVSRLELKDVPETSAEDIALLLKGDTLELVIDGALSEWGSLLEEFIGKLERSVTTWSDGQADKRVILHFSESETPG